MVVVGSKTRRATTRRDAFDGNPRDRAGRADCPLRASTVRESQDEHARVGRL